MRDPKLESAKHPGWEALGLSVLFALTGVNSVLAQQTHESGAKTDRPAQVVKFENGIIEVVETEPVNLDVSPFKSKAKINRDESWCRGRVLNYNVEQVTRAGDCFFFISHHRQLYSLGLDV